MQSRLKKAREQATWLGKTCSRPLGFSPAEPLGSRKIEKTCLSYRGHLVLARPHQGHLAREDSRRELLGLKKHARGHLARDNSRQPTKVEAPRLEKTCDDATCLENTAQRNCSRKQPQLHCTLLHFHSVPFHSEHGHDRVHTTVVFQLPL